MIDITLKLISTLHTITTSLALIAYALYCLLILTCNEDKTLGRNIPHVLTIGSILALISCTLGFIRSYQTSDFVWMGIYIAVMITALLLYKTSQNEKVRFSK